MQENGKKFNPQNYEIGTITVYIFIEETKTDSQRVSKLPEVYIS